MNKNKVLNLTHIGILSALALVLLILLPGGIAILPATPWLRYDLADVPVLLGTLLFGPVSGLMILAIVSMVQALFFSSDGFVGLFMHFCATGSLLVVMHFVSAHKRTLKKVILGILGGVITMIGIMVLLNLYFIPVVYGISFEQSFIFLPWTILFNLIKGSLNGILSILVWKNIKYKLHK